MSCPDPDGMPTIAVDPPGYAPRWRVLIVDDSDDDAELVDIALHDQALPVETRRARNETAMREALRDFGPQLVLCDVNIPGFACEQALALVRAQRPGACFVFLTGALHESSPPPAADGLLLKDHLDQLPALVRKLLQP